MLALADVLGCARGLLAAVGLLRKNVLQLQRSALHVELEGLTIGQPRGELTKRGGDALALGLIHDERVDRADLQVAHVLAVLPHEQPVLADHSDIE